MTTEIFPTDEVITKSQKRVKNYASPSKGHLYEGKLFRTWSLATYLEVTEICEKYLIAVL
ncbi:hypothetical protein WN48_01346 [Eufriesea mexicana]|uniref:Uncharacterized protein n=1 Tax=Eufriesea mexicana TaxID=516756 RepID=A0A310SPQ9_9HYME|nr:hypothetical protein WN48_01346 [Eufriesea mexicana]